MPTLLTPWEQVQELKFRASEIIYRHLNSKGWTHTSDTPHHRWMWKKKINRITYCVNEDDAQTIQKYLDEER